MSSTEADEQQVIFENRDFCARAAHYRQGTEPVRRIGQRPIKCHLISGTERYTGGEKKLTNIFNMKSLPFEDFTSGLLE